MNFERRRNETEFLDNFGNLFHQIGSVMSSFGIVDFLDIVFVAFIFYQAIKLLRETRAFQLAKGLLVVAVVYFAVSLLDMNATAYLFNKAFSDVILVLIILFHPELRRAIEHMGRSMGASLSFVGHDRKIEEENRVRSAIIEISKAAALMSEKRIGSLIIFENKTLLGDIIKTGTVTDSEVSAQLVGNIFFPNSPLHDGAAIVRDARLHAAGCVLPLTQNSELSSDLGMRHRAALGVTEQSDAVALITSEETGTISLCYKGVITRNYTESELREKLFEYFAATEEKSADSGLFGKIKKIFEGLVKNEK